MASGSVNKTLSYTYGTDGIWTYRKYDDGTYHAWYNGAVNLAAGTAWGSGFYYHMTSSALNPPSFSTAVQAFTGAPNGAILCFYAGYASDYKTYWVNAVASSSQNVPVRLDMYGTW